VKEPRKVRPVYSNDRKAPRMKKATYITNIITKELWKKFKEDHPEHSSITWAEFSKSWLDIAQTIRNEMVTNDLGVKLPSYTGELKVQYLPHKFSDVDQGTSSELQEKVNHVNLVTKGKIAKIKWERRWAVKFNKMLQFFAFSPTREIHKLAKKHIDEYPEKLRTARNTLGGYSIWRQLK
jgi:hypothetical protein